jgi:hypothetical protein
MSEKDKTSQKKTWIAMWAAMVNELWICLGNKGEHVNENKFKEVNDIRQEFFVLLLCIPSEEVDSVINIMENRRKLRLDKDFPRTEYEMSTLIPAWSCMEEYLKQLT